MGDVTPLVSAVMPCLNEADSIGACIEKATIALQELDMPGEVVVGDNGSSDGSREIARALGARVVSQPIRGYGAALQAAIEHANGAYVVMADADGSYDWSQLGPFVEKLEEGFEVVVGNRFAGGIMPGAMPLLNRYVGNPVLSKLTKLAYDLPVGDMHCGMRAFTRDAYEKMKPTLPGMEFATEMIVKARQADLRMAEIPIVLHPDLRSGPSHLRPFRDGWRHLRFILTYAPNYLYFVPGTIMFLVGVAMQLLLIKGPTTLFGHYVGIHFLALGALLTFVGFSVLNLGMLAKLMLIERASPVTDRLMDWLKRHFTLERGLIVGGALLAIGLLVDAALFYRWLTVPGPMGDSAHIVFVATSAIAISVNVIFSSFLIGVLLQGSGEGRPD